MSTADNSHEMQTFESPFASTSEPAGAFDNKKQARTIVTEVAPDELGSLPEHKPSSKRQRPPSSQQWIEKQADRYLPLEKLQSAFETARKFVLRIQDIPPSANGRQIPYDAYRNQPLIDERVGRPFISNIIRSSKYTPWNFVPRQLIAQFGKFANFYFLVISIMQMIPGLSTTGNYTTIVPLFFFVSLSMAKEGYEDLRRHRLDKDENNRYVNVLHAYNARTTTDEAQRAVQLNGPIHWGRVKWQSLQVGDIVRLERDEAVPADMIILGSKGPNNSAFVETMALDGETNLKNKQPLASAAAVSDSIESLAAATMHLTVEDPNLDLYNFEGKLAINDQTHPLTNNEVIYRGSVLRNTPEIFGIVIYSGEECKIRMNSNKNPRIKAPSLQARVNRVVLIIVCIVLFLTIFNAAGYSIWRQHHVAKNAWYLHRNVVPITHIVSSPTKHDQ
jgi:phospholipid-translocating ATPase